MLPLPRAVDFSHSDPWLIAFTALTLAFSIFNITSLAVSDLSCI